MAMKSALSYFAPIFVGCVGATARAAVDLLSYAFVKPSTTHTSGLVLVTGAARGLGRAVADVLSAAGYTVIAGVRKESDGAKLVSELPAVMHYVILDVGDSTSVTASVSVVNQIAADTGLPLVGVVNNAGVLCIQALELTSPETFDWIYNINVTGVFRVIQAYTPFLRASKGRIINISSGGAEFPIALAAAYQSSKAAVSQLSNVLRVELYKQGITVCTVCPGAIRTEMIAAGNLEPPAMREGVSPDVKDQYAAQYATVKSMKTPYEAEPEDVARTTVLHAMSSARPHSTYYWGYDALVCKALLVVLPQALLAKLLSSAS